jgi:hypothetical protein
MHVYAYGLLSLPSSTSRDSTFLLVPYHLYSLAVYSGTTTSSIYHIVTVPATFFSTATFFYMNPMLLYTWLRQYMSTTIIYTQCTGYFLLRHVTVSAIFFPIICKASIFCPCVRPHAAVISMPTAPQHKP